MIKMVEVSQFIMPFKSWNCDWTIYSKSIVSFLYVLNLLWLLDGCSLKIFDWSHVYAFFLRTNFEDMEHQNSCGITCSSSQLTCNQKPHIHVLYIYICILTWLNSPLILVSMWNMNLVRCIFWIWPDCPIEKIGFLLLF
jgi:hypothetical protein